MNKLFDQFKNVVVYDYEYKFTRGKVSLGELEIIDKDTPI